jgi:hypothetical protein
MPIRINLLAEAQALEELRRRDPIKRVIWAGAFLVILTLAVSSWLQLQIMIRNGELNRVEGQLAARTNDYRQLLDNQRKLAESTQKLGALYQMATNRLLYGTLLNALQQTTFEEVQLMRLHVEQSYARIEEVKPKTNATRIILGTPARATEKIVITLEARDNGASPGDQVNKFKQALGENPYFRTVAGKTNDFRLTSLSPPQTGERPFVAFTVECRLPEKTR